MCRYNNYNVINHNLTYNSNVLFQLSPTWIQYPPTYLPTTLTCSEACPSCYACLAATLKHVAKTVAHVNLSDHLVDVVFVIFDENGK